MAWFHRFFRSIFTKLIFISLLAWFLILLTVIGSFVLTKKREGKPFFKNISLYIEYLIKDLGYPPELERAKLISKRTGMEIAFSGRTKNWQTSPTFPDIDSLEFTTFHKKEHVAVGDKGGAHVLRITTPRGIFYFQFTKEEEDYRHIVPHLILFTLITLILIGCYLILKKILQPLKWLGEGVSEISLGNLDHTVPSRGNDELTKLTESFNTMTERLKKIMTTKEHLLRDVSHELRSPLTRMKIALEMMDNQELKKDVIQDISEMESMVSTILHTARDHHIVPQKDMKLCDIGVLLQSISVRYIHSTPGVLFTPLQPPVKSHIHEKSLRTVFTNLIENSLKFSAHQNIPVMIKLTQNKDVYEITIRDYGCGIDEEHLPFVFEPFYRIDKSRSRKTGGFGLGLSLCKSIVEAHKGKLNIRSVEGVGTDLILTLPLFSHSDAAALDA